MEESDQGASRRENATVLWIAKADVDPYWDRCAGHFPVVQFDNLYEAVTEVLLGRSAGSLVVNVPAAGTEIKSEVKILLGEGFSAVYLYTTAPKITRYLSNGDARVTAVENPDQLFVRLKAALPSKSPSPPTEQISEKTPVPDASAPTRRVPPSVQTQPDPPKGLHIDVKIGTENEPEAEATPEGEPPKKSPAKEFQAAQLTPEELQALLGPDIKQERDRNHE